MGLTEGIILLIAWVGFPALSLWLIILLFRLRKLSSKRLYALYGAVILATISSWPLSMIYIPLALAVQPVLLFFAFWKIAKLPPLKSVGVTVAYAAVFALLQALVVGAVSLYYGHS